MTDIRPFYCLGRMHSMQVARKVGNPWWADVPIFTFRALCLPAIWGGVLRLLMYDQHRCHSALPSQCCLKRATHVPATALCERR